MQCVGLSLRKDCARWTPHTTTVPAQATGALCLRDSGEIDMEIGREGRKRRDGVPMNIGSHIPMDMGFRLKKPALGLGLERCDLNLVQLVYLGRDHCHPLPNNY